MGDNLYAGRAVVSLMARMDEITVELDGLNGWRQIYLWLPIIGLHFGALYGEQKGIKAAVEAFHEQAFGVGTEVYHEQS